MAADVRYIPALREWHADVTAYRDTLLDAMAGVEMEIRRAHDWLAQQVAMWRRRLKEYEEDVVKCKAELSARKFPNWEGRMPDTTVQEENLRAAVAKVRHAEDQIERTKKWIARLPRVVEEEYAPSAHRLAALLDGDVPRGLAVLARRAEALELYAGLRAEFAGGAAAAPPPPAPPPQPPEAAP